MTASSAGRRKMRGFGLPTCGRGVSVPVSTKPAEVRMGSGKGAPEYWVARVKPGRVMFEIDGVTAETAREALTLGAAKLPIKPKFVTRLGAEA